LVACLLDLKADAKQIRQFQEAIDRHGMAYLDEILRRFQWRAMFWANRQRMNVPAAAVTNMLKAYEQLLIPMADYLIMAKGFEDDKNATAHS